MIARARKRDVSTLRAPVRKESSGVLLHGINWELYEQLLQATDEQHLRMTYDRGDLEIMSPQPKHDLYKWVISRWISVLGMECGIEVRSGGSTTFRRRELSKGLEPDDCFWIQNEPKIRDKIEFDFAVDPPPDLALEIDNTSSSLNRQGIYAALKIPELWRYDDKKLSVLVLRKDGKYAPSPKSRAFPFLPLRAFQLFFRKPDGMSQNEWIASFQKWVRSGFK